MAFFTVQGIHAFGGAEGTDNFAVEQTRFARRSPRRSTDNLERALKQSPCEIGAGPV
jgi:hypothetical protein